MDVHMSYRDTLRVARSFYLFQVNITILYGLRALEGTTPLVATLLSGITAAVGISAFPPAKFAQPGQGDAPNAQTMRGYGRHTGPRGLREPTVHVGRGPLAQTRVFC